MNVKLIALADIPEIVVSISAEGKPITAGPLRAGELVDVPEGIARILIEKGVAAEVADGSQSTEPTQKQDVEPTELREQFDRWQCFWCKTELEYPRGERPKVCPNPNCLKRGPFVPLTGPWRYFDGSRFVPKRLADELLKVERVATHRISWVIYRYCGGVYLPDGEARIREMARQELGPLAKESYVSEVVNHIRDTTFREAGDFNPPPNLICLENGVLDLHELMRAGNPSNLTLQEHKPDPIFLNKLPIEFQPDARAPTVGRRLLEWVPKRDAVKLVQFAGFCLYRSYFLRKALVLVGGGRNGKTTFLEFLIEWLGRENVASVPVQDLDESRFSAFDLFGRLANVVDDLPSYKWFGTGRFKQLTGGSPMSVERKFHQPFWTYLYAKCIFAANKLPEVSDETEAFWDRIEIVTFPNTFDGSQKRPEIVSEMLKERSGFLNAALAGLELLLKEGRFFGEAGADQTRERYVKLSDPVQSFAEERIIEEPDATTPKDEIYGAYVEWCRLHNFSPTINSVFTKLLKKAVPNVQEGRDWTDGGRRVWRGIRLRKEWEMEPEETQEKGREELKIPEEIAYFLCW
ncbi:MAG: phage/plasmid primase, P4 family [Candidatus Hadarchaeales archaeon]